MAYLVVLIFGAGAFGLCAIALPFLLRFFLLTWLVRLIGKVVDSIMQSLKNAFFCMVFIFGTALLGAFIIGIGLQIVMGTGSSDPITPILIGLLSFFVIVAVRAQQWRSRRTGRQSDGIIPEAAEEPVEAELLTPYPAGYEGVVDAWNRAIELAPARREALLQARTACAELAVAAESHDALPNPAIIDTTVLIRNHLAALVQSTERRLRSADPAEKAAMTEEMVHFLIGFGRRAQTDLAAAGIDMEQEDAALRSHLASQLFD